MAGGATCSGKCRSQLPVPSTEAHQPWENIVAKKKPQLHEDWNRLGPEANSLNIPYGTVQIENSKGVVVTYKLDPVYVELLKIAYMWGLQNKAPW